MRVCTASDGKLGEGLYCKRWEAGRGPVLQAMGSWARVCTANDRKLGDGKLGKGLGMRITNMYMYVMSLGLSARDNQHCLFGGLLHIHCACIKHTFLSYFQPDLQQQSGCFT